mgnify:CR=1 FL=1
MNWFKKLIVKWVREDWDNSNKKVREYDRAELVSSNSVQNDGDSPSGDPILQFKVYSAVGGKIVEFRRYDRKTGDNYYTSYIISEDQNFGDRIAKISSLEILK